jgi:3-hydroxypropanoate dehydrogenase
MAKGVISKRQNAVPSNEIGHIMLDTLADAGDRHGITVIGPATLPDTIDDQSLDQLFRAARTHNGWLDRPVPQPLLRQAIDLAKMGPTSANTLPMRVVFVVSAEAKARLKPALAPQNVDKTMLAPVTAIVGYDLGFPELLPKLFPHVDARAWFAGNAALIADTAYRNGSLQGGYLILALRAVGLDVGPMSGFDAAKVDTEFFVGTQVRTNFLMNIGYGDTTKLFPRSPRLAFEEIARFA